MPACFPVTICGGGNYQLKTDFTVLGNSYTVESRKFLLYPYEEELAHQSIKVETYQTGNIIGSEFDYSTIIDDLPNGWYSSIRLPGTLAKSYEYVEDNYFDSSYRITDIRPSTERNYTLDTEMIPQSLADSISTDNMLSNSILLTRYDMFEEENIRQQPVAFTGFDSTEDKRNGKVRQILNFKDRFNNIIKRNF